MGRGPYPSARGRSEQRRARERSIGIAGFPRVSSEHERACSLFWACFVCILQIKLVDVPRPISEWAITEGVIKKLRPKVRP
jgi:hypothetical protein